ncbi:MAG: hypothetical protein ABI670_05435 [Chloroflexota bacterium]
MPIRLPGQAKQPISREPGLAFDCELAGRVTEGDPGALRQLVDRHAGRVANYLLRRLGEGHDELIDKIVATTFAEAIRHIGPYAKGSATTPMDLWLVRLAEKSLAKQRPAPTPVQAQTGQADTPSDLARLRLAMTTIPERQRFVLALAIFEQMPAHEIAQTLPATPAGAMRRLRTALKGVSKALEAQEEAE